MVCALSFAITILNVCGWRCKESITELHLEQLLLPRENRYRRLSERLVRLHLRQCEVVAFMETNNLPFICQTNQYAQIEEAFKAINDSIEHLEDLLLKMHSILPQTNVIHTINCSF